MSLANYFETYKEEIALIRVQNHVEVELYSLIAHIIRSSKQGSSISVRDFSRGRSDGTQGRFIGEAGFPDFVIFERNVESKEPKMLGAVEAKDVSLSLDYRPNQQQLQGHITSYNKVIHTNGLIWRLYDNGKNGDINNLSDKLVWEITIGEINKSDEIDWHEDKWQCLLNKLDEIDWHK